MITERWDQVRAVLEEVLLRPEEERTAFLEKVCAGDAALRAEVESLLTAHEQADRDAVLESPFIDPSSSASSLPGRIGPYRVVHEIGRGGMGTVYLAERADGQFRQTVAVKVLRRGLDTDDLLSRFRYERQILASLDHPNIARLLDGGMTEDDRPYFVMEYIEGEPITEYCDRRRLLITQRIALFQAVCRAVAYAHRNLIVHRDLKPSNILVTEEGTVKLLDFGIAKLLDENASVTAILRTRTGLRLMTPAYAAPEQIRGTAVTTSTDVYQLGIVLYELLTGHGPYRVHGRFRHEIEQVILEEMPTCPSTVVQATEERTRGDDVVLITPEAVSAARAADPARLLRQLRGDLDTIVLKALRKEPERRYAAVEQLGDDLHRYLHGLPVTAQRDSFGYRASKFVRRHHVGVAATLAFLLALVGGLSAALWQARRAQVEATKAEQINTFLHGMLSAVSPHEDGRDVTVAEVLDEASRQIETELLRQPEVEAAIHRTIGVTYQHLGRYDEAESHLQRALALRRQHLGRFHPETAQSLKDVALIKHWQGNLNAAAEHYQRALTVYRNDGTPHIGFAETLNDYGTLLMDQAHYAGAADLFEEALAMNRRLRGPDHLDIASNLVNLGLARHWLDDVEAADTLYRQALAMQHQLVGEDHIEVAHTLNNLAWVLLDQNDLAGADSLFRASLAIRRTRVGNDHPDVAIALTNLATLIHIPQANFAVADTLLAEALALCRRAFPDDAHPYTAIALFGMGYLRMEQDLPEKAEPLLRESLTMRTNLLGADSPLVATTQVELGRCLLAQHAYEQAEPLLQAGFETLKTSNPEKAQQAIRHLITLYNAWGKPAQAQRLQARMTDGTEPGS